MRCGHIATAAGLRLPLPLAGEGWSGGLTTSPIVVRAPTRIASTMRYDLPRKRERCSVRAAMWMKLLRLHIARLAVAHQAVDVHADVGGFGGGVGERDGAVEGDVRFVVAAELH